MSDPLDREIRRAFWKIFILHHAAKGEVYGMLLLQELAEHGRRLSPGTLYPALARMVANGWLVRVDDSEEPENRRAAVGNGERDIACWALVAAVSRAAIPCTPM